MKIEREGEAAAGVLTHIALWVLVVGVGLLIGWSAFAHIDQITRAPAQIIASARTQVIQAMDAGVLTQLHVKEGEQVRAGQALATLEKARAKAAVDDSSAKVAALQITLARLRSEVYGKPLEFERSLLQYKDYIDNQRQLCRWR